MATIEVDGQTIEAEAGRMLIEATDKAGIYIPRFCYHEKLSIAANCRMCLVEVERAPKPLPACATPITDGMKVFTQSELARQAQKGTLEFLLINHPLDCPVCDQGGECPLQDQAMGYGNDDSRFAESKRVVPNHNIGPLVATEMTRCIHCTRCVRFGEEIAGIMEMGAPGRGEFTRIGTFLNQTVDSEVSGNMIDLCPVGALTSKPYRFTARSWELRNFRGISPHDCVGANLNIQTLRNQVERVLPIANPEVNDCWLADRDRYSYEAVNSDQRLTRPMIRDGHEWKEVEWEVALKHASAGIRTVIDSGSADDLGGLAGYTSSLEEYYLLQKLIRVLGSNNIDHRMQQSDFRDDAVAPAFPASEMPINQFDQVKAALLVGSNIRKEQPLLALRLRTATLKNSARISSISPINYPQNFATETIIANGRGMVAQLAKVAAGVANAGSTPLPGDIEQWIDSSVALESEVAQNLIDAGFDGIVVIGALAQQHADASVLKAIAQWICQVTHCKFAILAPGNSSAAWQAGCLPHRDATGRAVTEPGLDAGAMLDQSHRAYLLLATDPELDSIDGKRAGSAMKSAGFVVQITAWKSDSVMEYADVLLPMAAFTESAGTFVNCEGRVQQSEVAAPPRGDSRPAWKILRVLGNFLDLAGFDYVSLEQVTADVNGDSMNTDAASTDSSVVSARMGEWPVPAPEATANEGSAVHGNAAHENRSIQRLVDMPMYRGDQTVRNAAALQRTADNPLPSAHMNPGMIENLGLVAGDQVLVRNGDGSANLPLQADDRIPSETVYVPAGYMETAQLGGQFRVTVEKA